MKNKTMDINPYQHKIFTIPNMLSFFRLCLIPPFIWLYCVRKNYVSAGLVLIASGATDLSDGFIARRFHMISDLGKALDPIADKLTQAALLFCLLTRFPLMIILIAVMAVKELFMGITGLLIIKKTKKVTGAGWHGKAATVLLDAAMILHVFWYDIPVTVSNIAIALCVFMMIVSFILYGKRNIGILKE